MSKILNSLISKKLTPNEISRIFPRITQRAIEKHEYSGPKYLDYGLIYNRMAIASGLIWYPIIMSSCIRGDMKNDEDMSFMHSVISYGIMCTLPAALVGAFTPLVVVTSPAWLACYYINKKMN